MFNITKRKELIESLVFKSLQYSCLDKKESYCLLQDIYLGKEKISTPTISIFYVACINPIRVIKYSEKLWSNNVFNLSLCGNRFHNYPWVEYGTTWGILDIINDHP